MASRFFYTHSPHCWSLEKGEEDSPFLMGESMAVKKEETKLVFIMGFPCKLFLIFFTFCY